MGCNNISNVALGIILDNTNKIFADNNIPARFDTAIVEISAGLPNKKDFKAINVLFSDPLALL